MKERIACSEAQRENCPLRQHFYNKHHKYFFARWYTTQLEQEFRNLPENIEMKCTYEHQLLHEYEYPPKKPSVQTMLEAVMRVEE